MGTFFFKKINWSSVVVRNNVEPKYLLCRLPCVQTTIWGTHIAIVKPNRAFTNNYCTCHYGLALINSQNGMWKKDHKLEIMIELLNLLRRNDCPNHKLITFSFIKLMYLISSNSKKLKNRAIGPLLFGKIKFSTILTNCA